MTKIIDIKNEYESALKEGGELIRKGEIVAFPTETVYGLGADAMNKTAIKKIFEAKGRPSDNPLIVHIWNKEQIFDLAKDIPKAAQKLMEEFWPGPFTMVLPKKDCVPKVVTGGLDTVAVRMPGNKFARDFIKASERFIAAPSANLSGKPSPSKAEHVFEDFNGKIPLIIDGGSCDVGVESTVCTIEDGVPLVLRPGGVTPEMIRKIAGDVKIHKAVLGELGNEKATSPGMKYKHYAPKAKVIIFVGEKKDVAKNINSLYDNTNYKCAVMCESIHKDLYKGKNILDIGGDDKQAAENIFDALRKADKYGYERVFFHGVETGEMGLAVMNRMIRAAGHDVREAAKEVKID